MFEAVCLIMRLVSAASSLYHDSRSCQLHALDIVVGCIRILKLITNDARMCIELLSLFTYSFVVFSAQAI